MNLGPLEQSYIKVGLTHKPPQPPLLDFLLIIILLSISNTTHLKNLALLLNKFSLGSKVATFAFRLLLKVKLEFFSFHLKSMEVDIGIVSLLRIFVSKNVLFLVQTALPFKKKEFHVQNRLDVTNFFSIPYLSNS